MLESDYLVRAITKNGEFRTIAISTKILTEEARQRHNLSHTAAVALGRTLICGILLCHTLRKTKGHLTLKIKGNGPLGGIIVDSSNEGTVRGYVENPMTECFDKKGYVDIDKAVGKSGYVHVSYDHKNSPNYTSTIDIISGEIAQDVVSFLATSEQIRSYISCGIYLEPNSGEVLHAGGVIVQAMPKASNNDLEKLEETVSKLDPFSILLRAGMSLEDIIKKTLSGFEVEILSEYEGLCFYCGCNKIRFQSAITALGKEEIKKIINTTENAEGRCHFCNNTFLISKEELIKLIS